MLKVWHWKIQGKFTMYGRKWEDNVAMMLYIWPTHLPFKMVGYVVIIPKPSSFPPTRLALCTYGTGLYEPYQYRISMYVAIAQMLAAYPHAFWRLPIEFLFLLWFSSHSQSSPQPGSEGNSVKRRISHRPTKCNLTCRYQILGRYIGCFVSFMFRKDFPQILFRFPCPNWRFF